METITRGKIRKATATVQSISERLRRMEEMFDRMERDNVGTKNTSAGWQAGGILDDIARARAYLDYAEKRLTSFDWSER